MSQGGDKSQNVTCDYTMYFTAQIARRGRIEIAHSSTFHTFDALPR
jgi:hypothetical protein